jgi:hypothetical protein
MNHKEEHIISEEEIKTIEHDVNGKLEEMDKLRDFFGSGHGVNIVNLISVLDYPGGCSSREAVRG